MKDLDLLTSIHGDVQHIRKALDEHIEKDERNNKEFLLPMWNTHQQNIGISKSKMMGGKLAGYCVNAAIAFAAACAAIKGIPK